MSSTFFIILRKIKFPLNTDLSKAPDIAVISHILLLPMNTLKGFICNILF